MIRVGPAQVEEILLDALHHEQHVHVVDGGPDRESVYDAFVAAFELPEYFGRNLDALMDSLRDVADRHDGPWLILWRPHGLDARPGEIDAGVADVLADLEEEYPDLGVVIG